MKGFFQGSATALITPFHETGVNYEVLGQLIEHQIAGGTDAIVFLGTTGEPSTMSFEEEHILMEYAVKKVNGRTKVIFGCGSNNTADAIMTAQKAEYYGAAWSDAPDRWIPRCRGLKLPRDDRPLLL